MPTVAYVLLAAHFVADFICQSDWMALNKSKRGDALTLHCGVYAGVLGAFVGLAHPQQPAVPWATFVMVNFCVHIAQDAITSRINARLWQANERHWFFVGIGADQLLHYVTLFVTAGWWLH